MTSKKYIYILTPNFFHRINLDAEGFDMFLEISKIQNYITQSNKEELEKKEVKIKELKEKLKKI